MHTLCPAGKPTCACLLIIKLCDGRAACHRFLPCHIAGVLLVAAQEGRTDVQVHCTSSLHTSCWLVYAPVYSGELLDRKVSMFISFHFHNEYGVCLSQPAIGIAAQFLLLCESRACPALTVGPFRNKTPFPR